MTKQKATLRIVFTRRKTFERLERDNSRFGDRTGIFCGCRCHSLQNIFCEQKLAEDQERWCINSVAGTLEHRLYQKNGKKASTAITKLACDWKKRVFEIATFEQGNTFCQHLLAHVIRKDQLIARTALRWTPCQRKKRDLL